MPATWLVNSSAAILLTIFLVSSSQITDFPSLKLDLPDPESDKLNPLEFLEELENAWKVCDRFDLQTEIWRGRILRLIRDREKLGGEGRGAGFLQWLREREISKSRAYGLIQLADSADNLVGTGLLEEASVNLFSKRAFVETAQSSPEIQQIISDVANEGNAITRRQVKRLSDEFTSVTSPLLPEEIRLKTQENLLPHKFVAPLVRELQKLPNTHQNDFRKTLKEEPDIECIKDVTSNARWISKSIDAFLAVRALQSSKLNIEKAMNEAQRVGVMGLFSNAMRQAQVIESSVLKLHNAWGLMSSLQEKLWIDSGSSTPHLREVLSGLQNLSGGTMRISLGEISGGKTIRLQIVEESSDHLDPPTI